MGAAAGAACAGPVPDGHPGPDPHRVVPMPDVAERRKRTLFHRSAVARAAGLALLVGLLGAVPARAGEIAVVVSDRAPVQTLTPEQVRAVYLGEHPFWGKVRIFPVAYSENAPIMQAFLARVLGMDVNAYKVWWIRRIFRDGDVPPTRVGSTAEALRVVASHPGGIGFVEADQLTDAAGVRTVLRFPG